jgi:hypothetical protein
MATTYRERDMMKKALELTSFISVILIGVALAIGWALHDHLTWLRDTLTITANILAYFVVACYAFVYAIRRSNVSTAHFFLCIISWGISVVLIAVFVIMPIINNIIN